jgi:hypothetical protein
MKIILEKSPNNCRLTLASIRNDINGINSKFESILHLIGKNRVKRGWFDGIGTVFKTIFGTLDENDANYYNDAINKVAGDEKQLISLLKDQTQVVTSTILTFNETVRRFQLNELVMNDNLKKLEVFAKDMKHETVATEYFVKLLSQITLLQEDVRNLENQVDNIIQSILFSKNNVIHPSLISPMKLFQELSKHVGQLTQGRELPIPLTIDNIHSIMDISSLTAYFYKTKIIYIISVPLTSTQDFTIFKVTPLPIPHNPKNPDIFSLIQNEYKYIGITRTKMQYIKFNDLDKCKSLTKKHFICKIRDIFTTLDNGICETKILTETISKIPSDCSTKTIFGKLSIWHEISHSRWIFVQSEKTKVTIDCPSRQLEELDILGTGLLKLEANCKAYTKTLQFIASNDVLTNVTVTKSEFNIVNEDCCIRNENFNATIPNLTPLTITNANLDELRVATHKLNIFQDELKKMKEKPTLVKHSNYFTITIYILIGLVMLYFMKKLYSKYINETPYGKNCIQIFNQCHNTRRNTPRSREDYPAISLTNINAGYKDDEEEIPEHPRPITRTMTKRSSLIRDNTFS